MKLKTALELLGDDGCMKCFGGMGCDHDLKLVARRAREEAYGMAAQHLNDAAGLPSSSRVVIDVLSEEIRALPTEPTP